MDGERPEQGLGELLYAVLLAADDAGRAVAERLGMGANDLAALQHLFVRGPAGPVDLGRALGIGSAAATMLVDRLERAGHVERHPHPQDRRRRVLMPTDHARREVWRELGPLLARLDAVAAGLDEPARAAVAGYLGAVLEVYRGAAPAGSQPG